MHGMSRLIDRLLYGRPRYQPSYPGGGGYGIGRAPALELLVPMCCAKCEEKVYEEMMELRGVQGVMVDREAARVIVHGFVDPHKALRRAKRVKRDSQIWNSGAPYGRDFFSSPKYRRSSYVSPSIYRSSALEYQPSVYQTSAYEPSVYRSSYNRYTPSYGLEAYAPYEREMYAPSYGRGAYGPSYGMHHELPMYDDMVTNPYYMKHVDSEYY